MAHTNSKQSKARKRDEARRADRRVKAWMNARAERAAMIGGRP